MLLLLLLIFFPHGLNLVRFLFLDSHERLWPAHFLSFDHSFPFQFIKCACARACIFSSFIHIFSSACMSVSHDVSVRYSIRSYIHSFIQFYSVGIWCIPCHMKYVHVHSLCRYFYRYESFVTVFYGWRKMLCHIRISPMIRLFALFHLSRLCAVFCTTLRCGFSLSLYLSLNAALPCTIICTNGFGANHTRSFVLLVIRWWISIHIDCGGRNNIKM